MKRLVWGIVLASLGLLAFIGGAARGEKPEDLTSVFLLAAGGGVLIYFGLEYIKRGKIVTEHALEMLRLDDKINAGELAHRIGIKEMEVREHLAQARQKGIIPFKTDIV